jgi:zinc protease
MRSIRYALTSALMVVSLVAGLVVAKPLPTDPAILGGTFANGVTWKYQQHDNPPGKMAMMIHIKTGSLNEKEDQRGLAHFIEHMCFNGTENFPPGELIPYFESIGMEFGADLNAFTSFDQTAYMLFTPDTDLDQIDRALMVLSDYAFRATLLQEEIDKERGVVLEEKRSGKSAGQRMREKLWPELFKGARFAERLPIGVDGVLEKANRDTFVDYYRTWYRPENVTIVLVGDAKPDAIVPLMKKWFGQYKPTAPAREQKGPEFKTFTKQRSIIVTDPEMTRCDVQMLSIRPGRPATVTVEQARTDLVEYLGSWIVGRRCDERVNKGEASYRGAGTSVSTFFNDALMVAASASGEPEDWSKMLTEVIEEVKRAREFGFTKREFDLAKKEILAGMARRVKTESTRSARGIIRGIVSAVNDGTPVMSAQQDLDLYNELFEEVDVSEVAAAYKNHFTSGTFTYVLQMPEKDDVDVPERDEVLAVARAAWKSEVKPIAEESAPTKLLASMPTPGKIVETTVDKDLDITSMWLSNGVRVHHRYMDYKEDVVLMSVSLAGGRIEETAKNKGVTSVALLAINEAATSRLTSTNMRDLMTGKNTRVHAGAGRDWFAVNITGSPDDLETGLQKVYALLTDGKIEQSAYDNWKLRTLQTIEAREKMPRFKAIESLADAISGGDPRMAFDSVESVEAMTIEAAQAWFDRLRTKAPIEVAIVGDIKLDAVKPLLEAYIASLPKRQRDAGYLDKLRKLARTTGPLTRHVEVATVTPQAMAIAGFMGCEARNTHDRRAMELAAHIMTSRLVKRLREELSIVYSIRAGSRPSKVYADSGQFTSGAPCDPKNALEVTKEVQAQFAKFAESGPTDVELDNAKKQVKENLDTDMREPRHWWGVLRDLDLHHGNLNEQKEEKAAFQRFTADEVKAAFKKYYKPIREFNITAVPTLADKSKGTTRKATPAG